MSIRGCTNTDALLRLHVDEIEEAAGGDINGMISIALRTLLSILSSIYRGNKGAVAHRWRGLSDGVIEGIESGDIELGQGRRH